MSKDFKKCAYFVSRASNFAIVIRPDKKKLIDGVVNFEPGLRVEFNNRMLEVAKTPENEIILQELRKRIEDEKNIDPKRRSFYEEAPPKNMIAEEKVLELVGEKNATIEEKDAEIARLKSELAKKNK